MTKGELVKLLSAYDDGEQVLVESLTGGFEEPKVYITAARARRADEFEDPFASEYIEDADDTASGAIIIGTPRGLLTRPV